MKRNIPTRIYDGCINPALITALNKEQINYSYGWKANSKLSDDQGHWNIRLHTGPKKTLDDLSSGLREKSEVVYVIWEYLKKHFIGNRALNRVYINGYTFGTDGYIHKDDPFISYDASYPKESPYCETVIVYLNEEWDPNWGGETAIFNKEKEIVKSVLPKMGRVLVFDGQKLHASRPLSRSCDVLRKVLVFKTTQTKPGTENLIDTIRDLTVGSKHSGKTFFEHLVNTSLLAIKHGGADDRIVNACLFHSIYGTEYYKNSPKGITREWVTEKIGPEAEKLVHAFCHTPTRFQTFVNNYQNEQNQFNKELLFIEYCNILEQRGVCEKTEIIKQLIFT